MSTQAIPFKELPLSNNFIFGQVMRNPTVCKLFLEALLQKSIGKVVYIDKEKDFADTIGAHGIRLDIYLEDEHSTRYNIEMQCVNQKDLERRIRYYQSGIDRNFLERSSKYADLPESYVIFICDFDYYKAGLAMYERECTVKGTGIPYKDGSHAIILNTKYQESGGVHKDILEFLDYIRTNDGEIPVFGQLTKLARELSDEVRSDSKKEVAYMRLQNLLEEKLEQGFEQGFEQGKEKGGYLMLLRLYREGAISLDKAAKSCGMSETEFLKRVEENGEQDT